MSKLQIEASQYFTLEKILKLSRITQNITLETEILFSCPVHSILCVKHIEKRKNLCGLQRHIVLTKN